MSFFELVEDIVIGVALTLAALAVSIPLYFITVIGWISTFQLHSDSPKLYWSWRIIWNILTWHLKIFQKFINLLLLISKTCPLCNIITRQQYGINFFFLGLIPAWCRLKVLPLVVLTCSWISSRFWVSSCPQSWSTRCVTAASASGPLFCCLCPQSSPRRRPSTRNSTILPTRERGLLYRHLVVALFSLYSLN